MKIRKKAVLELAVSVAAAGLIAAAALHVFYGGIGAAYQLTGSNPKDHNQAAITIDGGPVDLAAAPQGHHRHPGQEDSTDPRPEFREIKSLTADEIRAFQEGAGYGMAKAAERNHYPGPRHVLDLADQLRLTEEQKRQIGAIEDLTRVAAISAGSQLIADEQRLNILFADNEIDQSQLASLVKEIAALQGRLRLVHLYAHLETRKVLSPVQVEKYDELRGYEKGSNIGPDMGR